MKHHTRILAILCIAAIALLTLASLPLAAADATTAAVADADGMPWQLALIPLLTPLIIAGVKLLTPKIPGWLIPILAPVLGCVLDLILYFAAGTQLNIWLAMLLGLSGVGVREILDQLKQQALSTG